MSVTAIMVKLHVTLSVISVPWMKSRLQLKLPSVASMIDKLAKRGTIHKNKASNLKAETCFKGECIAK